MYFICSVNFNTCFVYNAATKEVYKMDSSSKNMQDLLRFAIQHQQSKGSEPVQIDEEKKMFLDHVLKSMSVNVIEEFLEAIRTLQNDFSGDEEKGEALDLIRDFIDNIDFANSFVKLDGADILLKCVKHPNKTVSIKAISIVAEMSQNNPFCQQYFLQHGIIEQLITYLANEDSEIVASALYALSALIRNYEPALMEFIKKDGIKQVHNCLNIEYSRTFSKACFFITSISSQFTLVKDEFAKLGVFNKLIKKLRIVTGYQADIEIILGTMSVIIESRYCNPSDDENKYVVDILKNIVKNNANLPESEEIVLYSNSILRRLESGDEVNNLRT